MLAFGLIVAQTAWGSWKGRQPSRLPIVIIAAAYTVFGLAAFLAGDMNPHFLLFIATGVLLGLYAAWKDPVDGSLGPQ